MKVTYNWLKDFVDITLKPEKLADKLTMAGIEVKSIEDKYGDFVFEIEITSNRPDWLSVIGLAREVAAVTGKKIKPAPRMIKAPGKKSAGFSVQIQDKSDCPVYTVKIIRGVAVAQAPDWMRKRLELVGCRSINNIVDITNYVLFEQGEPLHAFDLDTLEGSAIIVRRAKSGETLLALDGTLQKLTSDILVIADAGKPVALAGIMGGKDTEVTERTQNILLEAAIFNPLLIRRGRQRLGLQTEASYRFERSIDEDAVAKGALEAARLIALHAGGRLAAQEICGRLSGVKRKVIFDVKQAADMLGVKLSATRAKGILQSLGFGVRAGRNNILEVTALSSRKDVSAGIDLTEEVARVVGYENIPVSLPSIKPAITGTSFRDLTSMLKNALVGLGLNEVITYSLVDRSPLQKIGLSGAQPVRVTNPLSQEQAILRTTLLPSLLQVVSYNLNQQQEYVGIFEVSKSFGMPSGGGHPLEEPVLGIALCGHRSRLLAQGAVKETAGLLHLKGILQAASSRMGIKDIGFAAGNVSGAVNFTIQGKPAGILSRVAGEVLEAVGIKNKEVVVAEIALKRLFDAAELAKHFQPMPVYPGVARDTSFVIRREISVQEVIKEILASTPAFLREVKVVDSYQGAQIPSGSKGLTISCMYRCDERTLTEADVQASQEQVRAALSGKFQATLR